MSLLYLSTAPKTDDYVPLQEHQAQTPSTFFGNKPVLYVHYSNVTLSIPTDKLQADASVSKFHFTADEQDSLVKNVDIWVTSDNLTLFQHTPTPTGVSIPYPSIALHATLKYRSQTDALYMNIYLTDLATVNADEDIEILDITVLPPNYPSQSEADATAIKEIFTAMNACADLHPDPEDSDEGEGGPEIDDSAPGASGWITAENMGEFLDENGELNMRGMTVFGEEGADEPLGPGAGTVRGREEDGEHRGDAVNGVGETKWQRTE